MTEKLLPCPFCGPGNSCVDLWHDDVAKRWRVGCGACGCSTGTSPRDKTQAPAIEAWNRRTPAPGGEAVEAGDIAQMTCFANNHGALEDWAAWCRIRASLASPVVPVGVSEADINELRVVCDTNQAATDDSRIVRADDLPIGVIRRILAALRPTDTGSQQ